MTKTKQESTDTHTDATKRIISLLREVDNNLSCYIYLVRF